MSNRSFDTWEIFDPLGMFQKMRDAYLESTARAMVDLVNSEEYAQTMGTVLSACLTAAEPLRVWTDRVMPQVLAFYGLPSRKELLSVASRANHIEMQLDDIEATLEEFRQMLRENHDLERRGRLAAV